MLFLIKLMIYVKPEEFTKHLFGKCGGKSPESVIIYVDNVNNYVYNSING